MKIAYEAMDQRGATHSDVLEVSGREEAARELRRRGLYVTRLAAEEGSSKTERADDETRGRFKFSLPGGDRREMMLFTRQMSMLMGVGTGVVPALAAITKQARNERWKEGLEAVRVEVEEGAPLAQALTTRRRLFNPVFCSMVAAGEATATLPAMFTRLFELARQQYEVRNRVIGAVSYPVVLMGICFAVTMLIIGFVLPRFTVLFETLSVELPASTAQLIKLSGYVTSYWPYLLGMLALGLTGLVILLRSEQGRLALDQVLLRVPGVGGLIKSLIMARICRLLGLMIDARVPLLEAVDLAAASTPNTQFKALLHRVRQTVTDGLPIAAGLEGSPLVSPGMLQAIATGEEGGNVAPALLFVADCLDEDNTTRIGSLAKLLEPIILVFMGLVVGGVAISLFMPLFDMASAAVG